MRAEDRGIWVGAAEDDSKKAWPLLIYILYAANLPDLLVEIHISNFWLRQADAYNDCGLEPILFSKI